MMRFHFFSDSDTLYPYYVHFPFYYVRTPQFPHIHVSCNSYFLPKCSHCQQLAWRYIHTHIWYIVNIRCNSTRRPVSSDMHCPTLQNVTFWRATRCGWWIFDKKWQHYQTWTFFVKYWWFLAFSWIFWAIFGKPHLVARQNVTFWRVGKNMSGTYVHLSFGSQSLRT